MSERNIYPLKALKEKNVRFMKQRYYEAGPKATKLPVWLRKQHPYDLAS